MSEPWFTPAREPSLEELFNEPIVQMIMRRDGVRPHDVQHQLHKVATAQARRFI